MVSITMTRWLEDSDLRNILYNSEQRTQLLTSLSISVQSSIKSKLATLTEVDSHMLPGLLLSCVQYNDPHPSGVGAKALGLGHAEQARYC